MATQVEDLILALHLNILLIDNIYLQPQELPVDVKDGLVVDMV